MTHLMSIAARIAVGRLGLLLPVAGLAQTSTSAINGTIQDTWRVSDKLTFNWGGLIYESNVMQPSHTILERRTAQRPTLTLRRQQPRPPKC